MPDEDLLNYIKNELAQGRSEDTIRSLLLSNGRGQKDIDDAFTVLKTGRTISVSISPQSTSSSETTLIAPAVPTGTIITTNSRIGMRTRTKVILWIVGVMVGLIAVGSVVWMMYGKTIGSMITIQYLVHNNGTLLNITPTPHMLAPVTPAASTTFSYLGLTLSAPWVGVSSTKEGGTVAVRVSFTNGKQFTIMKASEPNPSDVTALYNALHISTYYELETAVYDATPGQVDITTSGNDAILTTILLTDKSVIITPFDDGSFYSFNTNTIKGFQHGDPAVGGTTLIEIYDQTGDKFTLTTTGATQGEIDYLLASIRAQ